MARMQFKDYVTLAATAAGASSMAAAIAGRHLVSAGLICLSVLLDYLDGKLARASKNGADEFGKQLDSLSDTAAFGAAPMVLLLSQRVDALSVLAATAFVCAGVLRLARFNIQKEKGVFFGLPIPAAALASTAATLALEPTLASASALALSGLMISPVRIPKF